MKKLNTPFGEIIVSINGIETEYIFEKLPKEKNNHRGKLLFSVDERYRIIPQIEENVTLPIEIKCFIKTSKDLEFVSDSESGESLNSIGIYSGNTILHIGCIEFSDHNPNEPCGSVLESGLVMPISHRKFLPSVYFCLAWNNLIDSDDEKSAKLDNYAWFVAAEGVTMATYTWFAADPFYSEN